MKGKPSQISGLHLETRNAFKSSSKQYVHSPSSITYPLLLNKGCYMFRRTALLVDRSRDRYPVVSLGMFSDATDGTTCPGVDSASKNEYQENSWG
jgi:hypothetical protein